MVGHHISVRFHLIDPKCLVNNAGTAWVAIIVNQLSQQIGTPLDCSLKAVSIIHFGLNVGIIAWNSQPMSVGNNVIFPKQELMVSIRLQCEVMFSEMIDDVEIKPSVDGMGYNY